MDVEKAVKRPERHCPPRPDPYPWVVYFHGKDNRDQTFCTISNPNKTHRRRIPELRNKDFWGSYHGWCLLSDEDHRRFFLWNPVTFEKIRLPPLEFEGSIRNCMLSSDPNEPCCMVMLFASEVSLILIYRVGDEQWTELNYKEELKMCLQENGEWVDDDNETLLIDPIICNGNVYAFYSRKSILLLINEIKPKSIEIRSLHVGFPSGMPYAIAFQRRAVEYCGEIYGIKIMLGGIDYNEVIGVEVRRLDFSKMVWEKMESAKDLAFFVGYNCSFCCPPINPETEGGRVYFTPSKGKNLYAYNIEDGSLSVSPPFPNIPKQTSSFFWLMPHISISIQEDKRRIDKKDGDGNTQVQGREGNVKDIVEKGDAKETHFSDLPLDIASVIAKRLILVDYLHYRSTCRKCLSVAPHIQWKKTLNGLETHSLSPWLVFFEKDSVCTFIDPKYGDKYLINLPQLLSACEICYSKDGWLLMSGSRQPTFFFNPFTREILQLPNLQELGIDTACIGLSSSPTSSNCLLVEICNLGSTIYVKSARIGGEGWLFYDFEDDTDFRFYNNSPVFYNGAFYYLGQNGNLGVLEIMNNEVSNWKVLPKPERPCSSYLQNFLVECDGELLSVFVGHFGKWVRVFRLSHSTMTWIKVECLGKNMLYVSRSSSFSTMAKTSGMENKIYFPKLCGQSIVFYSLETKKFHSFESKDSVVDFYSTREQLHCGWIEPRWY